MRQAIEEGFILDVLQNYMTYKTCFEIANSTPDNPDVPISKASKVIKKFQELLDQLDDCEDVQNVYHNVDL